MEPSFPVQRIVDEQGNLLSEQDWITKEFSKKLYRHMLRIRLFDKKAVSLQRQGRIGTYAPFEGQEASQVGSALALDCDDWLFPTYRDHGATMTFGQSLLHILLFWKGRNEGNVPTEGKKIFPPGIPIATQIPHSVGAAYGEVLKGTTCAAIAYFGDGATSEGDFHEGLNIASVINAPVVFFNQNNQYAISVPIHKQMKSQTIAQKGLAYDIPSVRIDGNDPFVVYMETRRALERARTGEGPTLIEAVTWRYGAHTTADDPSKYRDQAISHDKRVDSDPIDRVERFLKLKDWYDHVEKEEWLKEIGVEIDESVDLLERYPKADPALIFDYVFEHSIWPIEEQKKELLRKGVLR